MPSFRSAFLIDIKLLVVQADDGLVYFFDMRIYLIVIYVVTSIAALSSSGLT